MISITPGSHAFRLISLLLLVGEFPFQGLGLIGDARTLKALAVKMSQPHEVQYQTQSAYNCFRCVRYDEIQSCDPEYDFPMH